MNVQTNTEMARSENSSYKIILLLFAIIMSLGLSLHLWRGEIYYGAFLPHIGLAAFAVTVYGIGMTAPIAAISFLLHFMAASQAMPLTEAALLSLPYAISEGLQAAAAGMILRKNQGDPGNGATRLFLATAAASFFAPAGLLARTLLTQGYPGTVWPYISAWLASCVSLLILLPLLFSMKRKEYRALAPVVLEFLAVAAAVSLLSLAPSATTNDAAIIILIAASLPFPLLLVRRYGTAGSGLLLFIIAGILTAQASASPGIFPLTDGLTIPLLQIFLLAFASALILSRPVPKDAEYGMHGPVARDELPRLYREIFSRMNSGFGAFRNDGSRGYTVEYLNDTFCSLFSLDSSITLPVSDSILLGASSPPFADIIGRVHESGVPEESSCCTCKDKKTLALSAFPLTGEEVALIAVDVSNLAETEESLLKSEERLKLALDAAKMGIWEYDPANDQIILSDNMEEIAGLKRSLFKGAFNSFLKYVHSDDRNAVKQIMSDAIAGENGRPFFLEYRLKESETAYRWIESTGKALKEGKATGKKLIGTITDVTWEKKSEEYLRLSEKKFQQIFREAPIAVSIFTMDGKFIEVNGAFLTLTGYNPDDLLTMTFNDITHPEDLTKEIPLYHSCLRGETKSYTIEKRYLTRDGGTIWVNMTAAIIEDDSMLPLYLIAMAINVTEKKLQDERIRESLEEKNILLKEIHHRVKNNMQIISSILSLQTHGIEDERIIGPFLDCQNRVHTMALVHEKLYQSSDISKICFNEYIGDLVNHLYSTYTVRRDRVRTLIEMDEINLGIDTAIPLALIINELMSNAMKYAFSGRDSGTITVRMHRDAGEMHTIIIGDDGIGLPEHIDFRYAETLGLQLVSALTGQLKGKLSVERIDGTVFTIIF